MKKSVREFQKEVKKAGFVILNHTISKSHHKYLIGNNNKTAKLIVSSTPSDRRGTKNLMSLLKRKIC